MTIHWCGTGLSALPGLRRLLEAGEKVTVWNRTVAKAQAAVGDLTQDIRPYDQNALKLALSPGDIVVSMLPADQHVPLAQICLQSAAHFVSSSYVSPEMQALHAEAVKKGLCLVNEVGLDPGIDHLMAHDLVADYRQSDAFDPSHKISFLSYCGGVPKHENPFRYKFSWSPLGVLKALKSSSRSIQNSVPLDVARPWDALGSYTAPLPVPENFEVYPNRDSLPFMAQYDFDPSWQVETFVRGTLRLEGWAEAWSPIFAEIETLQGPEGDQRLRDMSDQFWNEHAYQPGEPDRVILCVDLRAQQAGATVWHKTYVLDAWGDERGSAMARLVSVPVSLAIIAIGEEKIQPGVSAAPSDPSVINGWLSVVSDLSQYMQKVDNT